MKNIIAILLIAILSVACKGKDKGALWMLGLAGDGSAATTTNPDGSTTTTSTNSDGSTVQTTANPDGSTVTVTTTADGSVTTTATTVAANGSTTAVTTNPDGSTVSTTTAADGSVSTTTNADGSSTATTTKDGTAATDAGGNKTTTDEKEGKDGGHGDNDAVHEEHDNDAKVFTVAFEDSYPNAGDGDYNDLVVVVSNDVKKNDEGQITSIKSTYRLVAKGSGFNHILKVRYPVSTGGSYRQKIMNADGSVYKSESYAVVTAGQFNQGLALLPETKTSITGRNVSRGDKYAPGMVAETEVVFDFPVAQSQLGKAPFDIFINIENKNDEIHMSGFGGDFKNAKGYPGALAIPGFWKWQYEGTSLYRDNQSGYGKFAGWVDSNGAENRDWYKHVTDASKIYPVPASDIAGYMGGKNKILLLSLGLLLIGAAVGFVLRKQLIASSAN